MIMFEKQDNDPLMGVFDAYLSAIDDSNIQTTKYLGQNQTLESKLQCLNRLI